jgi:serine/threonine-protein kinase
VQIFDHGVHQGLPYIVMELLEGESLATRLARHRKLPFSEALRIITHIARALSRAHAANVVHRDLKPENVFLVHDDDEPLAKLLDFGIAKAAHNAFDVHVEQTTSPGILVGTPFYASPEQAQGAKLLDHRSDIWALGVIAYECLVGERPFRGEALAEVLLAICAEPMPVPSERGCVPPGFDAWFARACARDLDKRFESAKAAASALAELCGESQPEEVHSLPRKAPSVLAPSTLGATAKEVSAPHRERPFTVVGAVSALALAGALVGALAWYRQSPLEVSASAEPSVRAPSVSAAAKLPPVEVTARAEVSPPPSTAASAAPAVPPGPVVTVVTTPPAAPKLQRPRHEPARPRPEVSVSEPAERASVGNRASAAVPDGQVKPHPSARVSVDLGI